MFCFSGQATFAVLIINCNRNPAKKRYNAAVPDLCHFFMFFADHRKQFFRPLTSKYRAQIIECLRQLYGRLYTTTADYSRNLGRDQLIEIFQEAITRAPLLDSDGSDDFAPPVKNEREQANWVLNLLLEHGWLERLVDEATLTSTYAFSRFGRLFTQPMVETAGGRFRTRHRNTRNTRNALKSFVDDGDVYDLLDAYEYSERIISDFSDVIAELDERKRQLVQEVEAQQIVQRASDEFFDFMEKRFMPDLAIRLSADSVEKYRDEIQRLIKRARRRKRDFKANAERELRKTAPELIQSDGDSVLLKILDGIEQRLHSASATMLPALRVALSGFTRRADIIIRQLSYSGAQHNELLESCSRLRKMDPDQRSRVLQEAGEVMSVLNCAMVDPDSLKLYSSRSPRRINSVVEDSTEVDFETRRALYVQQILETAFAVNNRELHDYIVAALNKGHRIHSQNLPVHDAREFLLGAHAIEIGVARNASSEFEFRVEPSGNRVSTEYFDETDEFVIELVEH